MNISPKCEIIKKPCVNVDDPKTDQKERMKAISLIMQCYNRRFELVKFEPKVNQIKEYIDIVKRAVKEIESREKALQAYLDGRKLKTDEVYKAIDPNRVF